MASSDYQKSIKNGHPSAHDQCNDHHYFSSLLLVFPQILPLIHHHVKRYNMGHCSHPSTDNLCAKCLGQQGEMSGDGCM